MAERAVSAFAAAVGRLGELSESELRQLYLIIGVRLGFPDGVAPSAGGTTAGQTRGGTAASGSAGKTGSKKGKSGRKGNPARKSQWANHPLYQEYSRLKKVVERQAKESNLSFNAVRTDESRQYRTALSQWLNAKSLFRDRNGQENDGSDEESEDEAKPPQPSGSRQPVAAGQVLPEPLRGSWASDAESEARREQAPPAATAGRSLPSVSPATKPTAPSGAGGSGSEVNPPTPQPPSPPRGIPGGKGKGRAP